MIQTTNNEHRKALPQGRTLANKCGRNDGKRPAPLGHHHTEDQFGQESSVDGEPGGWSFEEERDVVIISENIPTKY